MPFHGSATADAELHNPRGVDAVPLDLTDNSATAYRIRRDDGASYPNILSVNTSTGSVALTIGNTTDNPTVTINAGSTVINAPQSTSNALLIQRGSGDPILSIDTAATSSPHNVRVREAYVTWDEVPSEPTAVADRVHVYAFDNAGTVELRARTTAGIVNLLDTGSSLTGTHNLSWTVNEDATAAVDADPFVRLLGGDGVVAPNDDLVRTTLTQDSSAEALTLTIERARNGAANVELPVRLALGTATLNRGTYGYPNIDWSNGITAGSVSMNTTPVAHANCVAIGISLTVGGARAVAIGSGGEAQADAVAIGYEAIARDPFAVAIGYQASVTTTGDYGVAIGHTASAAQYGVALGQAAVATSYSVCLGNGAVATTGSNTVAIGRSAAAADSSAVAVGYDATAAGLASTALGSGATANNAGDYAVALGADSQANAAEAIAIGRGATAGHANSVAIGRSAGTTAANQLVLGSASYATNALFLGRGVTSATTGTTTINATGGSGTNIAGHGLTLAAGRSTGNATPGALSLQLTSPTSSGSTLQTLYTAGAIEHASAATSGSGNTLAHHYQRSEPVASAGSWSWNVWHSKTDNTAFDLWSLDLASFASGALLAAGTVGVYARIIASGLYSGTRRSAYYMRRARYEVNGTAATIIDTAGAQHIGSDAEDTNGWDCEFKVTNATLRLECIGDADHATGWHADIWVSYTPDG
jgi:hypothetical protein